MCSSQPGLGKPSEASVLPPASAPSQKTQLVLPRPGPRSAPRWHEQSLQPLKRTPLKGVSGTDMACLGGQGSERHRACSDSHGELGQSRDLIAQPRVFPSLSSCPSSPVPPDSSLPHALTSCRLVSCRDTKASWDPSDLLDQRVKRWVSGPGRQLLSHIRGWREQAPGPLRLG